MKTIGASLLLLCALGCGGSHDDVFEVGETKVVVAHEAVTYVWPDLPEALAAMQGVPSPGGLFDTTIRIYPPWHPVGTPGHACEYEPSYNMVEIRARYPAEPSTADGCLPHELAHRWRYLEVGLAATGTAAHDNMWRDRMNQLTAATKTTWIHR